MFTSNEVHHSVRRGLANFVPVNRVSIEAFCAMRPRTGSVLDSVDILKRGDTDPWLDNSNLKGRGVALAHTDALRTSRCDAGLDFSSSIQVISRRRSSTC